MMMVGGFSGQGCGCPCNPQPSIGRSYGAQEWRDFLFLSYGINPTDFMYHCDVCGAAFSICHALDSKNSVFVTAYHNELRDGVVDLSGKKFTPAHVRSDPKISTGIAIREGRPKENQKKEMNGGTASKGGGGERVTF